jgi:putative FmdB family regulatory protein
MPIYEYECLSCSERKEVLQRFSDEPLKTCPVCGGEMKRLISNSSFILKGSGWYLTDYARKGNSGNGGGASSSGNGSSKSGEKNGPSTSVTSAGVSNSCKDK